MIDYDLLVKKIFEYLKILFPDFKTCRNYYYDSDIDSNDLVTKLTAIATKQFQYKIDNFNFQYYINENNHSELFEYIKNFLPNKYQTTGVLIFNTFAQRILFNVHDKEKIMEDNSEAFLNMIETEITEFIALIKNLPVQNDYLFYSNDLVVDEALKGKYLTENICIHDIDKNLVLVMKNMDFNIREYHKTKNLLVDGLALIFTEKLILNSFQILIQQC